MKTKHFFLTGVLLITIVSTSGIYAQQRHTCSTFQITSADTIVVGHNLDEYFTVPGIVAVNPRGIEKHNLSWRDFRKGKGNDVPRLKWKSKYGSITYSIFGRDLIDGGMNEAGLYIGEMTLMKTVYPVDKNKPTFHTNFFMQYILDCFATVDEALASFTTFSIDGTCRWHFFLADRSGKTAIIEFIDGETIIYKGESMPHNILCNTTYQSDLDSLNLYEGFGGERKIDVNDKENTKRSVRASEMLKSYSEKQHKPIINYSFEMLSSLNLGNNQWQVVCDITNGVVYFNTVLNRNIKFVNMNSFDFSSKQIYYIDIHNVNNGNVSNLFQPLTNKTNKKYVRKTWWAIDMGFFGNIFVKPFAVWMFGGRMSGYTSKFYSKH